MDVELRALLGQVASQVPTAATTDKATTTARKARSRSLVVMSSAAVMVVAVVTISATLATKYLGTPQIGDGVGPGVSSSPDGRGVTDSLFVLQKGVRDSQIRVLSGEGDRVAAYLPADAFAVVLSPDSRRVAYVEPRGEGSTVLVWQELVLGANQHELTNALGIVNSLAWERDATDGLLAATGDGSIVRISFPDGAVQSVAEAVGAVDIALSPDGSQIAFSTSDGALSMITLEGDSRPTTLVNGPGVAWPSWTPDGRTLAFVRFEGSESSLEVTALADQGLVHVLQSDGSHNIRPTWSPSGLTIAFSSDRSGANHVYLIGRSDLEAQEVDLGKGDYIPLGWTS